MSNQKHAIIVLEVFRFQEERIFAGKVRNTEGAGGIGRNSNIENDYTGFRELNFTLFAKYQ